MPNRFLLVASMLLLGPLNLAAAEELTFEKDIRPIFRTYCFDCHGANKGFKGELDLRLVRFAEKGGETGPALVKGNAADSFLLQRVKSGEMPPGDHRVPAKLIGTLEKWIQQGARTARPEPAAIGPGLGVTPEDRAYWSFVPVQRPRVPSVKTADRVRTPIDAFLLARMEPKGLAFAADADKATLIRRAYLGLIGLPPTPEQVRKFLADNSDDAWSKAVEELLNSPHYGERWGRHWLDVAGYAESDGYTNRDDVRAWAYKYRDWVIRAIGDDMAFDQFIVWQLAGDELVDPPFKNLPPRDIDKLTATGFLRMAADGTGSVNNEVSRNQVMTDTVKIVSSALLGLSVGCAQCHDHRYDPISHQDYYRLRAVFEPALNYKKWVAPAGRRISLYTDEDIAKAAEIEKEAQAKNSQKIAKQKEFMEAALKAELAKLEEPLRKPLEQAYKTAGAKRSAEQKALLKKHPNIAKLSPGVLYQYNQGNADILKKLDAEIAAIRGKKPKEEFLRVLTEPAASKDVPVTKLFHRGDYRQPQQAIAAGGLTVAAPEESPLSIDANDSSRPTTGRRLAYARWLTSGRHPLVARVLVNRFWLNHFGKTFVSTPDEFGKLGAAPTHPELIDWLADEFMAKGWSLKHLHRLIMTSTVYRQKSLRSAKSEAIDGSNDRYSHFPVRRLEAEAIRDSILAVSGRLQTQRFGAAVAISPDDTGQIVVKGDQQRRSVYLQVRRSQPVSILKSFDAPVMEVNCAARQSTTDAIQSLMLMNSGFILKFSKAFAERVDAEAKGRVDPALVKGLHTDENALRATAAIWSYGHGSLSATKEGEVGRVAFTPFPYFGQGQWKGGEKVPDAKLGFAFLTATGGHPQGPKIIPIRRWTSPVTGAIAMKGVLGHGSPNGDGVRLTIHSSRLGVVGRWEATNKSVEFSAAIKVHEGDYIDVLVDERSANTSDSFSSTYAIRLLNDKQETVKSWDSKQDFEGPTTRMQPKSPVADQVAYAWQLAYGRQPTREEVEFSVAFVHQQLKLLKKHKAPVLQAMTNYCQALFGSNEFLYVE